jgi:hypothetical protein
MNELNETSRLAVNWLDSQLNARDDVVLALTVTADRLSGSSRRKLRRLADEIAFLKTPEDVLRNPMALEIFLLLAGRNAIVGAWTMNASESSSDHRDIVMQNDLPAKELDTQVTTEVAVNRVLLTHLPIRAGSQRVVTMLAYPFVILLICGLVLAVFSWQLVPPFKSMYDEFGLSLPLFTKLLFQLADVVQSPLTYLVLITFLLCVAGFAWIQYGPARLMRGPASPVSFHGSGLRSTRGMWADWAWHVSLLLRAGISKADAIQIAGENCGPVWLRRGSQVWSQRIRDGQNPFRGVTHFRGEACQLLADALTIDQDLKSDSSVVTAHPGASLLLYQAGVLREVAEIYWDRDQQRAMWRLAWISPLALIGIGLIVLFVVASLFAPLIDLISGLS